MGSVLYFPLKYIKYFLVDLYLRVVYIDTYIKNVKGLVKKFKISLRLLSELKIKFISQSLSNSISKNKLKLNSYAFV